MKNTILILAMYRFLHASAHADDGETVYKSNCSRATEKNREGGVGQNLVDNIRLNGEPSKLNLTCVVVNGISDKGMSAWKNLLSFGQVDAVVDFC
jgi:hypothetical protein